MGYDSLREPSAGGILGEPHQHSETEGRVFPPRLRALFAELDGHSGRIPVGVLEPALRELRVRPEELAAFSFFDGYRYRRNELRSTPAYEALLICWRAGQRSPIHDHQSSGCAYRVLRGTATETVFARSATGLVYPTHTRDQPIGFVGTNQDDDIHQVSNLQERDDLITLHIYSPPLLVISTYSLTDPRMGPFVAPPVELEAGAGI